MRKLLRANFRCLWRSKLLWLCVAASFALSVFFVLQIGSGSEDTAVLDEAILQVFPFLPVLYAAFVSLFLGLEYQDGTLRNKLIAGHTRTAVYLSALVTSTVGCFAILAAWALGGMVGAFRLGWFVMPLRELLLQAAVILLLTAAEAAVLTLVGMLMTSRAASAVVSILLVFGLLIVGSTLYNALCEPEFASAAVATANGFEFGESVPNPSYISGQLRTVYRFAVDILPSGQSIQLANGELTRPILSLCASACIVLLVSAVGIDIFRRKDLK